MAFPETALDLRADLVIGGVRTDVTRHLYTRDPVETTYGMSAQGTGVDPSTCSLTLNNKDGRYSPRNPMSPYYGQFGRNTPLRVSVPGEESYLALDGTTAAYARTPDHSSLDIVGDLDIRIEATIVWAATPLQTLIGKWVSVGGQRSYLLRIEAGLLTLNWSPDGSTIFFAAQPLPALPRRAAVRATLDVNNGAGGFTARLYWAETLDGPWTQVGDAVSASGVTSIYSGTAPLEVAPVAATAWNPVAGRVHRGEVRSGIGGTVVAAPDMRALTPGIASWSDTAGRAWALAGAAEISNREYLFTGEVSSWPPAWSASGRDAWVPIEAAGILRRLGQGHKALESTLRRRIPAADGLLAYWPMEEGREAGTLAYSPVQDVQSLTLTGADWGAEDSLGGSAALPKLKNNPAALSATVPPAGTVGWQIEFVYLLPTLPVVQTEIIRIAVVGAAMRTVVLYASTSGVRLEALDGAGDPLFFINYSDADALAAFAGGWNRLAIYTGDAGGGSTRVQATWRDVATNFRYYASTSGTTAQGQVATVSGSWGPGTDGMAIGHLAAFSTPGNGVIGSPPATTIFEGADDGFQGESALTRLARLAAEEPAVPLSVIDGDTTMSSEQMGPQRPDTLLALLHEAAETDGGILTEQPDQLGLEYRDRASLYNQAPVVTLDYAGRQVTRPLEPVEDDQSLRNDVTVQRSGGGSARSVVETGPLSVLPPEEGGVGPYDESITLSLYKDGQAAGIAAWRAHLGTWDEPRYPTVAVQLHRHPELIPDVLRLRIGDLIRILHPPIWAGTGPVDLHVLQIKHTPLPRSWVVSFVCVPAGPWQVGVLENPERGRADTDGSALVPGASASATSWSVAVTAGPRWIDSAVFPAMFPLSVMCEGEEVLVTAITGTTSPQTFTVTRSVNGIVKAHSTGAKVTLTHPMRAAL